MTYPTNKALGMPLSIQCWDVVFHNGAITSRTFWSKHIEVIVTAICLSIAFMESFFAKLLTTLGTEKVFGVPSFIQSSHTFLKIKKKNIVKLYPKILNPHFHWRDGFEPYIQNGTVTVGTTWAEQVMVIRFAVWMTVTFKEVACAQLLAAVAASEMFRMPRTTVWEMKKRELILKIS